MPLPDNHPHPSTPPVDWEEKYQQNDTPWDKGEAAPPLVEYLQSNTLQGDILVPGCGAGYDVWQLATQKANITGLDIAPTAIEKAKRLGEAANIHFQLGDFFNLPSTWHHRFDCIVEHTCFCAIQPSQRKAYVQQAHWALKPGGHLLAIFFIIVDNPAADHPPFPVSPKAIDALFNPHFEMLKAWTPTQAYPSRQGGKEQMRWLRKR